MNDPNLLVMCGSAFFAVFLLLSILALVMHVITLVFPKSTKNLNPVQAAVISSTVQALIPGARVTRIEEQR